MVRLLSGLPVSRQLWGARFSISSNLRASKSSPKNGVVEPKKLSHIRNIGIVAHIDAGKTTATEKLLFLSGMTRSPGDVDAGSTVTDFMDMERERGISIQSAAVTFEWRGNRINLIDTPGHVDFTIEVERCARVLDGVVVVLDGSAGVQAQTLTVWKQAKKFELPATFYINKMDKNGVTLEKSIDSIQNKLGVKAILTSAVLRDASGKINGVVDLISGHSIDFSKPDAVWHPIQTQTAAAETLERAREEMCYAVAECDPEFMSHFLDELNGNSQKVDAEQLLSVLRRITLQRTGGVVSCGSALRCAASVRPILDSVVDFLPSPADRECRLGELFGDELSALVFKIGHDKRRGHLSFARIYTGKLKNNSVLFNSSRSKAEGPVKVFVPYSDELQSVTEVTAGNIAVISGLESTVTGDTLLETELLGSLAAERHSEAMKEIREQKHDAHRRHAHDMLQHKIDIIPNVRGDRETVVLAGIECPEPVYYCSIEPPTQGATHEFERALRELALEDPSMRVRADAETGQMIVETMGELHLEVIKDRLVRGYGLEVFLGPLQVGYRELFEGSTTHTANVEETVGEKKRVHSATLTMRIERLEEGGKFRKAKIDLPNTVPQPRPDWIRAINEGCANALYNGPVLGFPVWDIAVTVLDMAVSGGRIHSAILSACAHRCVSEALENGCTRLAEPVMKVEINLQDSAAQNAVHSVLQELSKRRALIEAVDGDSESGSVIIHSRLPLAEMAGLSSTVRTLSSGLGALHIEVADYQLVSDHDQAEIVRKVKGYV